MKMTIKNRLALYITGFAAVFVIGISVVVYVFSRDYTIREFNERLFQRVAISATTKLEADELNKKLYDDLQRRYQQKLVEEKEYFIEVDLESRSLLQPIPEKIFFPKDFFVNIFKGEPIFFQQGRESFCAITYRDNEGDFIILSSAVDQYGQNKLNNLLKILGIGLIISSVLIFLTGQYYARRALLPLNDFNQEVAKVQISNLNNRLREPDLENELTLLTRTFNQMLDRLETSFDIQNNFISNASHELKNPLAAILGTIEITLNKDRSPEIYRTALTEIQLEALRLEEITLQLLQLARTSFNKDQIPFETFDLTSTLQTIHQNLKKTKPEIDIQLEGIEKETFTKGIASLLYVAFFNLIDNACKFAGEKPIVVTLEKKPNNIQLTIIDRGIGIPEKDQKHIFEPFYRSTNTRNFKGFGIGLPLAKKIIDIHSGRIEVDSKENIGTTFKVTLPNL